ncbi:MAG: hypothetical protein J6T13_06325 [Bacteroidales bacterium]|nr:hypothetical protein [Bacteroidales bacterium]
MKQTLLLVCIGSCMLLSRGQSSFHYNRQDTLSNFIVNYNNGISCKIIQTIDLAENGRQIDSTWKIILIFDTNHVTIHLPIPDEEVKNFSFDSIRKTRHGIDLIISYGGGSFIIRQIFKMEITIQQQIYLRKIISYCIRADSIIKRRTVKKNHPKNVISEINLTSYMVL